MNEVGAGAVGADEDHALGGADQQLLFQLPVVVRLQFASADLGDEVGIPQLVLEQDGLGHVHAVHARQQGALACGDRVQLLADHLLDDQPGGSFSGVTAVEQRLLVLADLGGQAGLLLL